MCVGVSVCAHVCVGREGAEQTLSCMQETVAQSPHHQQRCDQPRNFTPASEYKLGELEEQIHSWGWGGPHLMPVSLILCSIWACRSSSEVSHVTEGLTCDIIAGPVFIYEVKTLTHFCMRILWFIKVGGKVFMVSVIASTCGYSAVWTSWWLNGSRSRKYPEPLVWSYISHCSILKYLIYFVLERK